MSPKGQVPRHWPFSDDPGASEAAASFRAAIERKQARESAQTAQREHVRHDRLIVGGRAHTKKHGLS
jgi:hypothetical protein